MGKTVRLTKERAAQYTRLRTQQRRHQSFAQDLINEAKTQFRYKRSVQQNLVNLQRHHNCSPQLERRLTAVSRNRSNNGRRALD